MAGYSRTPLAKKLGIKEGTRIALVGAPDGYLELVAPLPDGVQTTRRISDETDLVHIFSTDAARLIEALRAARAKLRPDGVIWVSWPKKASKVATDITEETIRVIALPLGLVDIKVCAVDETWSALKLVVRREKRQADPGVPNSGA
jgi:hypothetical protein